MFRHQDVDARAGQLYFGLYSTEGRKLAGPLLLAPGEAVQMLPADLRVAVGSGTARLAAARAHGLEDPPLGASLAGGPG